MTDAIARRFRRFAETEARGHSPLYETLAQGVASDRDILTFLAELPAAKQQPNLLLAAVRFVCGVQSSPGDFRAAFLARTEAIRAEMLKRRTQTNEPARCAVLLPVLARLPGPLALIEVGASAGLCLLTDRYGYTYDGHEPFGPEPRFPCRANAATPVPTACPKIVWRAGLDLNPLNVRDDADMTWLETLVWPDQPGRSTRLHAAIAVVGTAAKLGVKRRLPLAGMCRWQDGIFIRSRNREYHYRQRNEPAAGDRRHVATSASVGICSFGGSPGNWPFLR